MMDGLINTSNPHHTSRIICSNVRDFSRVMTHVYDNYAKAIGGQVNVMSFVQMTVIDQRIRVYLLRVVRSQIHEHLGAMAC
jgi:hypothetical protein